MLPSLCVVSLDRHLDGNKGTITGVVAIADAAHEDGHVAVQAALCRRMRAAAGCLVSVVADVILRRIVENGPDAILLQILQQVTSQLGVMLVWGQRCDRSAVQHPCVPGVDLLREYLKAQ